MKVHYDAVVIGSGFGGAITACRLAQAGQEVCVLEKGAHWQNTDFPRGSAEVADHAIWNEHGGKGKPPKGFIEYVSFRHMDVVQGVGVGGGSLHYFNVHIQPPAAIFENGAWPKAVRLSSLQRHYARASAVLAAKPLAANDSPRGLPRRTTVFLDAVRAAGQVPEMVPICVQTDLDGAASVAGVPLGGCDHCGNCLLGCHVHAKNTLDLNYLELARQAGAEIHAGHKVSCIEPLGEGYRVRFRRVETDEPGSVTATRVIVAAGTLGSNELLLRCRDQFHTLPHLSPALGTRFSGNGDFLFAGAVFDDKVVEPGRGPGITAGVGFREGDDHVYIEDLGYPDPFIWYFDSRFRTPKGVTMRLHQIVRYVKDSLGARAKFELDELLQTGWLPRFLPYLGMGTDAADGRLYLDHSGELELHWDNRNSAGMYKLLIQRMREISKAAGARFVNSFLWEMPLLHVPLRKTLTAHPLGGCVMADTPQNGVVNDLGEVWGYPGLYVADGSIVPSALAVNPTATISALAERVAEGICSRLEGRVLAEEQPVAEAPPSARPRSRKRTATS